MLAGVADSDVENNDTDIEDTVKEAGDSIGISKVIFHNIGKPKELDKEVKEIEFINCLKIGRSNIASTSTSEDEKNDELFDSRVMSRSHAVLSFKGRI